MSQSVIRYVVTHAGNNGLRTLAHAAQGRYTFATREEAEQAMRDMLQNNSRGALEAVFTLPLEVRACECWPGHFDPKGVYFD